MEQPVSRYLKVGKGVAIQFLNREPLEPPVSKYGTVGTGGCKQFLNGEQLEPSVSKYGNVGTGSCLLKRFLIWLQTVSIDGTVGNPVSK